MRYLRAGELAAGVVNRPTAEESERQVLGALLLGELGPGTVAGILARVAVQDFDTARHRAIFEVVAEMRLRGEPVDVPLAAAELEGRGEPDGSRTGGLYLADLARDVTVAVNAPRHAELVAEAAERRRVVDAAAAVIAAASVGGDWRAAADQLPLRERLEVQARPVLEVLDWPKLLADGVPEVDYLARPYLPRGARVWAWGPAGAAKSIWALLTAAALTREGYVVAYVSQENPLAEELRRVGKVRPDPERFRLFHGRGLDVAQAPHREALFLEAAGADLVVLDTLTACWSGDENDNAEIAALDREVLEPIAEYGTTVVVVDHTGHPQAFVSRRGVGAGRGASSKGQKADVGLVFRAEGQRGFVVEHVKNRMGGWRVPPAGFEVTDTDDDGLALVGVETSAQRAVRALADKMVEAVTTAGVLSTTALREAVGGGKDQQAEAMRLLEGEELPRVVVADETIDTGGGRQHVKAWRLAGTLGL